MKASMGPYALVRELGRGGMGVVYEARHPDLPRSVALKQLFAGATSAAELQRFGQEAQLLARVRHPAVVRVHTLDRAPEGPYVVTDLIEGESLQDLLKRGGPLEPERAATLTRELADGLAAVHAEGIVHRDLKPENVMLTPEGQPVLLDFGVARDGKAERLTVSGEVLGTPAFMAPEQALGYQDRIGPRSDVYGLGALLYSLLSARAPYQGATSLVILSRVAQGEPPLPLDSGVPPALAAIVQRAMSTEADDRYPDALALRDALDGFLNPHGVAPTARGSLRVGGPAIAAVVVLAIVAVIVSARDPSPAATALPPPQPTEAVDEPEPVEPQAPDADEESGEGEDEAKRAFELVES